MEKQKAFKFFSLVFSYPTEETLREMEELAEELSEYSEIVKKLREVDLETLQTEYTRLFVSSYPTLECPPYESYYKEGQVYGEASVEVRDIYERRGLEYTYISEPPDHISVELEFLALTGDKEFFERMKGWIFKFTRRVRERSEIYGEAARELEKLFERT